MRFIPPAPNLKKPKSDAKLLKTDLSNPHRAKYTEKYHRLKDEQAKNMAEKITAEQKKKKMDFLLDLVKALIIAVATLVIEHFVDIVHFFLDLLSGFSQG